MNKLILWSCLLFSSFSHAEGLPALRVAVKAFAPPFVTQQSPTEFYGFDIALMNYVCAKLQRRCEFIPMMAENFVNAFNAKTADIAIGALVIMPERPKKITFSTPYLTSQAEYLGSTELSKLPLAQINLNGKRIGVVRNSAYYFYLKKKLTTMSKVIQYDSENQIMAALEEQRIDIALVNRHAAQYWDQASPAISALGAPFEFGFGLGIAMPSNDIKQLTDINNALFDYQSSPDFKRDYDIYLRRF